MSPSSESREDVVFQSIRARHAAALAAAYVRNREHLAEWEPVRPDDFYTEEGQRAYLSGRAEAMAVGAAYTFGLFLEDEIIGCFNLNSVIRGAFQSASVGYWVDQDFTGQGLASLAVQRIIDLSRGSLGLHRLEAATLVHNAASQKVLARAGFEQIGRAPKYLQIAGRWQDHNLYQVLLHD